MNHTWLQKGLESVAKANGIKAVAVIDDAYDPPSGDAVTEDSFLEFRDALEKENAIRDALSHAHIDSDEIIDFDYDDFIRADETIQALWGLYESIQNEAPPRTKDAIKALFGDEVSAIIEKRDAIRPLIALFDAAGIDVKLFGSNVSPQDVEDFEALVIDCYLDFETDREIRDARSIEEKERIRRRGITRVVEKIHELADATKKKPEDRPSLILMSSIADNEIAQLVRQKTRRLKSRFRFLRKEEFDDMGVDAAFNLLNLFASHTHGGPIEALLEAWKNAADELLSQVWDDILTLDLPDFAYLLQYKLAAEGAAMGDYLTWLFSAFAGAALEDNAVKKTAVKAVNEFGSAISPGPLTDRSNLFVQMYSTVKFSSARGYRGSKDSYVRAGDVFIARENSIPNNAIAVISPECDLVASEARTPIENVLVVNGSLGPTEKAPAAHTDFLIIGSLGAGDSYAIYWDSKNVSSIPYKDFSGAKIKERGLEWAGQLRASHFLHLQRTVLADIERVGLPIHPSEATPVEIQVFVRAVENKASMFLRLPKDEKMAFTFVGREPPSSGLNVQTRPKDIFTFDPSFSQILYDGISKKLKSSRLTNNTKNNLQKALDEAADFQLFQEVLPLTDFNKRLDHISVKVAHSDEERRKQGHKMNELLLVQLIHPRPKN